jgi:hypothetical protein
MLLIQCTFYTNVSCSCNYKKEIEKENYTPTRREGAILQSPCPFVRSHFRNRYLSFYWKKWFYIWYMTLAWWLVPCLPFPGIPHIYFLFTWSVLLVEETRVPGENHWPAASHWQTWSHNVVHLYTSPWVGFKLTSVVIGTDLRYIQIWHKWTSGGILSTT